MDLDSRYILYNSVNSYGDYKRSGLNNKNHLYISYDLQQNLYNDPYIRFTYFFGESDGHIYTAIIIGSSNNSDYLYIYDIDTNIQDFKIYRFAKNTIYNDLCFYLDSNQICSYIVTDYVNNGNFNWYPRFLENFNPSTNKTFQLTEHVSGYFSDLKIGTNYIDDLMYSNRSTDILIYGLYLFIPILLFILLIKVFRKGLFK